MIVIALVIVPSEDLIHLLDFVQYAVAGESLIRSRLSMKPHAVVFGIFLRRKIKAFGLVVH